VRPPTLRPWRHLRRGKEAEVLGGERKLRGLGASCLSRPWRPWSASVEETMPIACDDELVEKERGG
jgi:hypothetical protein